MAPPNECLVTCTQSYRSKWLDVVNAHPAEVYRSSLIYIAEHLFATYRLWNLATTNTNFSWESPSHLCHTFCTFHSATTHSRTNSHRVALKEWAFRANYDNPRQKSSAPNVHPPCSFKKRKSMVEVFSSALWYTISTWGMIMLLACFNVNRVSAVLSAYTQTLLFLPTGQCIFKTVFLNTIWA